VETADDLLHSKLSSTIQDRRNIFDWAVPEPRERTGREMFCGVARGAAAKGREAITGTAMPRSIEANLQATNPELVRERRRILLGPDPAIVITSCEVPAALDLRSTLYKVKSRNYCCGSVHDKPAPVPMSREVVAGLPNTK